MAIRIQRILLPTDFSAYSAAATKYACEWAARFDAELHLLHALEVHLSAAPNFAMGLDLPKYVHESRAAAEKALSAAIPGSPKTATIKPGGADLFVNVAISTKRMVIYTIVR